MRKFTGLLLVWLVTCTSGPAGAVTADMGVITCDQTLSGNIGAAGQMDRWSFSGQAGERVIVAVEQTTGNLYPYVDLYAPDGSRETGAYEYVNRVLDQSGTYTVVVYDGSRGYGDPSLSDTGNYKITFLDLQGCAWPAISCDETLSSAIDAASDLDIYQFEGQAGERAIMAVEQASGNLYPYIELYAPDGSRETGAYEYVNQVLGQSGTYTIVVYDGSRGYGDRGLYDTGDYKITFVDLQGCAWPAISCDDTLSSAIDAASDLDIYQFEGQAGERAIMAVEQTSGSLYPYMVWYAPDGSRAAGGYEYINHVLTQTGAYTVEVYDGSRGYGDRGLYDTGNYRITFVDLQGCAWPAISCDDTLSSAIDAASDLDIYQFEGQAGERAIMAVEQTSGNLYPYMVWYAPDGSRAAGGYEYINHVLTQTGTYTVEVYDGSRGYGDRGLYDTGDYKITFVDLQGCSWPVISCDETLSSTIDAASDLDVFQFEGQSDTRVIIVATATSGALYPYIDLYAPDTSRVTGAYGTVNTMLNQTGTYSLVIYDGSRGYGDRSLYDTGNYNVSLTCLGDGIKKPDLVVQNLTVSPNPVSTGESATINWTVKNAGTLSATPTGYSLKVRLSNNPAYDELDALIDETSIPDTLAPGESVSGTCTLATGGLEGTYYVVSMVDTTNIVGEISENNNTASASVIIRAPNTEYTLTISSTAGGVTDPDAGDHKYKAGASASVQATAHAGFKFGYWDGTAVEAGKVADWQAAATTVKMDADYILRANFVSNGITPPRAITVGADSITSTSASPSGKIAYDGGEACEHHFLYWQEGQGEQYTEWESGASSGSYFTSYVGGLTPATTYSYQVEARNSAGTSTGEVLSFTTAARLTISAGPGGMMVEPKKSVVELLVGSDLRVVARADPGYVFWRWQGSAAEGGKVRPVGEPNATVLVNAIDTLVATFLEYSRDTRDDMNPAPCRGTEFGTAQYWIFGDGLSQAPPDLYLLDGVPQNGLPPLPGTVLEPDSPSAGANQWWASDVRWGSARQGLLAGPRLRASIDVWPSSETATRVQVQFVWHAGDEGDTSLATDDPYEPVLRDLEPAPLNPPLLVQEMTLDQGWRHSTYVWDIIPSPQTVRFALGGRIAIDTLIVDTCSERFVAGQIHVDDNAPLDPSPNDMTRSDPQEDGSPEHPFDSIQEGIDAAAEGWTVIVHAGRYVETIRLPARDITVVAEWLVDSSVRAGSILDAGGVGPAVSFAGPKNISCRLDGLTIIGGKTSTGAALLCERASPVISHCLVSGNMATAPGGAIVVCQDSQARFINCTFSGNRAGVGGAVLSLADSDIVVLNSIIWGNDGAALSVTSGLAPRVLYSDVAGGASGLGILDAEPLFAEPGHWLDNGTTDPRDDAWVEGDYHVQSQQGRLDPAVGAWVLDPVTSPCIDAGDPDSPWHQEPPPHGSRSNLGAYGGTAQASKSL